MATRTVYRSGVCVKERAKRTRSTRDEREQPGRDEARRDERQHDAVEGLQRRGAVDVRCLLEVTRQCA